MNALEALAGRLQERIDYHKYAFVNQKYYDTKAQRIIAELAKVRFLDFVNGSFANTADAERAVCKCRAIAEEGMKE